LVDNILEKQQLAMSAAKTKARWFRIYSADRKIRKAVGANTLEDLIMEGT